MHTIEKEYEYKPSWMLILCCSGFFGLCATVFIYLAVTNVEGVVINGLIHLGPFGATIFYWILATASLAFVGAGAWMAYDNLLNKRRIAITANSLLMPAGRWSSEECELPFESITGLKLASISNQQSFSIYIGEKYYVVNKMLLPCQEDFDEIMSLVDSKTNHLNS